MPFVTMHHHGAKFEKCRTHTRTQISKFFHHFGPFFVVRSNYLQNIGREWWCRENAASHVLQSRGQSGIAFFPNAALSFARIRFICVFTFFRF